ncbi:conjugal transfer protein TraF [Alcanivorax sp.]|uniref:conjugal transfer protein TraF n=1 Tax=Alcanivorax sp. TaxID=1872427 RepID=UPI00258C6D99|nr:conjugal transfer protein TraF [Alcanivorax sp.]
MLAFVAWAPMAAFAADASVTSKHSFFGRGDEGWFFYKEQFPPEKKKKPKPKHTRPAAPKQQEQAKAKPAKVGPAPFSAAWLKINLPKYLNLALDHPTETNVRAYLLLQKLSLDKSSRFALMAQSVSITDPLLDAVSRRPLATSGTHVASGVANLKRDLLLKDLSKRVGIWAFYSGQCPYCHLLGKTLAALERNYGFTVMPVSMDGSEPPAEFPNRDQHRVDSGQSGALGVKQSPAVVLINVQTGEHVSIVQGSMLSFDGAKDRILLAAMQKGWITTAQYIESTPENPVPYLSADTLASKGDDFISPEQVVSLFEGGAK